MAGNFKCIFFSNEKYETEEEDEKLFSKVSVAQRYLEGLSFVSNVHVYMNSSISSFLYIQISGN